MQLTNVVSFSLFSLIFLFLTVYFIFYTRAIQKARNEFFHAIPPVLETILKIAIGGSMILMACSAFLATASALAL